MFDKPIGLLRGFSPGKASWSQCRVVGLFVVVLGVLLATGVSAQTQLEGACGPCTDGAPGACALPEIAELCECTAETYDACYFNWDADCTLVAEQMCGASCDCSQGDLFCLADCWSPIVNPGLAYHPADLTQEGYIGYADLTTLLASWGCIDCPANIDGYGTAGFNDLSSLLAAWGSQPVWLMVASVDFGTHGSREIWRQASTGALRYIKEDGTVINVPQNEDDIEDIYQVDDYVWAIDHGPGAPPMRAVVTPAPHELSLQVTVQTLLDSGPLDIVEGQINFPAPLLNSNEAVPAAPSAGGQSGGSGGVGVNVDLDIPGIIRAILKTLKDLGAEGDCKQWYTVEWRQCIKGCAVNYPANKSESRECTECCTDKFKQVENCAGVTPPWTPPGNPGWISEQCVAGFDPNDFQRNSCFVNITNNYLSCMDQCKEGKPIVKSRWKTKWLWVWRDPQTGARRVSPIPVPYRVPTGGTKTMCNPLPPSDPRRQACEACCGDIYEYDREQCDDPDGRGPLITEPLAAPRKRYNECSDFHINGKCATEPQPEDFPIPDPPAPDDVDPQDLLDELSACDECGPDSAAAWVCKQCMLDRALAPSCSEPTAHLADCLTLADMCDETTDEDDVYDRFCRKNPTAPACLPVSCYDIDDWGDNCQLVSTLPPPPFCE